MQSKMYDSLFVNTPALLAAVEQHPFGAAAVFGLVAFVAWLKYRGK